MFRILRLLTFTVTFVAIQQLCVICGRSNKNRIDPFRLLFPKNTLSKSDRFTIKKLRWNNRKWNWRNPTYYSYTISRQCFCLPEARDPVDITVCGGTSTAPKYFENVNSYDKVFDFLKDELSSGPLARFDVEYDRKYGYPTKIYIDRDERIADEEVGYTISNFKVLNSASCTV